MEDAFFTTVKGKGKTEERTAERVTISVRYDFRAQPVENTEERATISFVIILLSRLVWPFSTALNAQRGGAHRGARHIFRAEEHTAERVAISVRHHFRAQRGGEHRGARHDFVRYYSLATLRSSDFICVERAARRSTPRGA